MIEVLPTDWSPRNTSLNFASGEAETDPVCCAMTKNSYKCSEKMSNENEMVASYRAGKF
jgi:hypothetical protein